MDFDFSVVTLPSRRVAGMKTKTDLENACKDCSMLWQTFGPRIDKEMSGMLKGCGESYGVSEMMDDNPTDFIYWAAVEVKDDAVIPSDMVSRVLPEGTYVTCLVTEIGDIGEAYTAMYEQWPLTQTDYVFSKLENGICFEAYPPAWRPSTPFAIYALVEKSISN